MKLTSETARPATTSGSYSQQLRSNPAALLIKIPLCYSIALSLSLSLWFSSLVFPSWPRPYLPPYTPSPDAHKHTDAHALTHTHSHTHTHTHTLSCDTYTSLNFPFEFTGETSWLCAHAAVKLCLSVCVCVCVCVCVRYLELSEKVRKGGEEKAIARHTQRHRKLLVRERLRLLLDDEDFLELSPFAGFGLPYGDILSAGTLTGQTLLYSCKPVSLIPYYNNKLPCVTCPFRHWPDQRPVVCVHCPGCHNKRWLGVPYHREEAATSTGYSHSEPPALHLPGWQWRRFSTTAGEHTHTHMHTLCHDKSLASE